MRIFCRQLFGQEGHCRFAHSVAQGKLREGSDSAAYGRDEHQLCLCGLLLQHRLNLLVYPKRSESVYGHQSRVIGSLERISLLRIFLYSA